MTGSSPGLTAEEYDLAWSQWNDFIKFNPGARHRRRQLLALISGISFKSVLDVGCGNGELAVILKAKFPAADIVGADVSPFVVSENQKRFSWARFQVLDLPKAVLPEQYDLVICSEVIEHISDQKQAVLNLGKMVKPGGYLVITCPTGHMYVTEKKFGHVHHPTSVELNELAAGAGLVSVKLVNWGWPVYRFTKAMTNVNPQWAIKNFATGSYSFFAKACSNILYYANYLNLNSGHGCQLFGLYRKR